MRVAAAEADLCYWDLSDPRRPADLVLSDRDGGLFRQPLGTAFPLAVSQEYTLACWVRLAPSGVAPLRCVWRGSHDLFVCTLNDQLGMLCGRDPSLKPAERFRPCLDEDGNIVQIDGSLGWAFVAVTGCGAAVVGRGGATATSGQRVVGRGGGGIAAAVRSNRVARQESCSRDLALQSCLA